jgi:hypothetical protein
LKPNEKYVNNQREWVAEAREFGRLFQKRFVNKHVTPYLHVFIYHLGYYIEEYGSIEAFSNYVIEELHQDIKRLNVNWTDKSAACKRWLESLHISRAYDHCNTGSENLVYGPETKSQYNRKKRNEERKKKRKEENPEKETIKKLKTQHWTERTEEEKKKLNEAREKRKKKKNEGRIMNN